MDTLEVIEPVQARTVVETIMPVVFKGPARKQNPAFPRKQKEEKWASTLDPRDLRCLMSILETSLIPQLVHDYSPAGSASPLPAAREGV